MLSRARFVKIKSTIIRRGWDAVTVDPKKQSLDEVLSVPTMFSSHTLYIHEAAGKLTKKELDWVSSNDELEINLLLWHKGKASASLKKAFPKITNFESFEVTQKLWSFLTGLKPGNLQRNVTLLQEILAAEAVEFVFIMIIRQFRDLYWVNIDSDTMDIPDWRKSKLRSQALAFPQDALEPVLLFLIESDLMAKKSERSLTLSLDLFILKHLK